MPHKHWNSSCLTSSLNLTFNFTIKIDSISQALPNLMGSMHDVSKTWVIRPIFANKYQSVHMVNMKMTMMKCGEKPNHGRNLFNVHLAYQNGKRLSCQHCNCEKIYVSSIQGTFAICINRTMLKAIKFLWHNLF
jgi:hypothetical protein